MRYRAFISYKHASSSGFAERLELALKAYAKPLWQPPLPIFRDEKYLKPGLDLPRMIAEALEQSEFLIYLASPDAARSSWVLDELTQWCSRPDRLDKLIIVLTEGDIAIDEPSKAVDWERTNAVPSTLRGVVEKVPFYLDCTQLASPERQTLLDPDFKKVVNRIVAAFRNIDPIEMIGQEIAQHRKNLRNRNRLVGSAIFALLLAVGGGGIALRQSQSAAAQSRISKASQLASDAAAAASAQLPQRALLLGAAASEVTRSVGEAITPQAEQTLRDLLASFGGYGLSGHTGRIDKLFFLRNSKSLLSTDQNGQVLLWQLDGNGRTRDVKELIAQRGRVLTIQVLNKERRIRFVTENGHVLVRSLASSPSPVPALDLPEFQDDDACATKVTTTQAFQVSSRDAVLRIWDLTPKGGSQPKRQKVAADALAGCMFSNDGQWLYVAADEQTPIVLRTEAPGGGRMSLDGATGGVVAASFSPQSLQIALAMEDGRLLLWDLDAGRRRARRPLQVGEKNDARVEIAYARSGRVLAVVDEKGALELWRLDGGSPRSIGRATVPFELYRGMDGRITFELGDRLLLVSDGLRAAAAIPLSSDAVPLGVQELHNHPAPDDVSGDRATPYALHPRRPILVTAGNDHNAYVWSLEGAALSRRNEPLRGHDEGILALAFSPDGKWLATAGNDRTIRLWPVEPAQWIAAPAVLTPDPSNLLLNASPPNPNGGTLEARFLDGEEWFEGFFERYEAPSPVRFGRLNEHVRLTEAPWLSPEGELIGPSAKEGESLRRRSSYPPLQRQMLAELHQREALSGPDPNPVFDFERGRAIVEAASDGSIRFWDLRQRPIRSTLYRGLAGPIAALSVNTGFGALAAVNESGQIAVWQIGEPVAPRFVRSLKTALASARPLSAVRAAGGTAALSGSFGSAPNIRFLGGPRWLFVDFNYLLDVGSSSGLAWRLPEGAHEGAVLEDCCAMKLFEDRFDFWWVDRSTDRPVRISPDRPVPDVTAYDYKAASRRLALGLLNGQVLVMKLGADGSITQSATVASHDFTVGALALSSDGRIVAAGSPSGITLTELADDLSVVRHIRLTGHRDDVNLLRFSPGDTWLLSGGEDNSVHVHPVSASQVVDLACLVAGRTLTSAEKGRLGNDAHLSKVCEAEPDSRSSLGVGRP